MFRLQLEVNLCIQAMANGMGSVQIKMDFNPEDILLQLLRNRTIPLLVIRSLNPSLSLSLIFNLNNQRDRLTQMVRVKYVLM